MKRSAIRINELLPSMLEEGITNPVELAKAIHKITGRTFNPKELEKYLRRKQLSRSIREVLKKHTGIAMTISVIMDEIKGSLSFLVNESEVRAELDRLYRNGRIVKIDNRQGRYRVQKWASK